MEGTILVIDQTVLGQIKACVALAEANPVDMQALVHNLKIPEKKEHHMAQMTRQTISIPLAYMVTFSIEKNHPVGDCRHLSMSVQREGRVPNPAGIWIVAKEFGFWGTVEDCGAVWMEDLRGHGKAVNIVQTVAKP